VELAGHDCGRDVLAPEMTPDPKIIVARGYDAIAEIYHRRFGESSVRKFWLDQLIARLPAGAHVLDLGCGSGLPVARDLQDRGFVVTGHGRSNWREATSPEPPLSRRT
jgi:predicted TPR repeat methyltransferase